MKLLLMAILLAAAFVGGYYFAQQPGSPNLDGWLNQARQMVSDTGRQVAGSQDAATPACDWDPAFKAGE